MDRMAQAFPCPLASPRRQMDQGRQGPKPAWAPPQLIPLTPLG